MVDKYSETSTSNNDDKVENDTMSSKPVKEDTLMKKNYSYPDADDPDLLYKVMKKREFYYHKTAPRIKLDNYADIQEYRADLCERRGGLYEHQAMLANIINPNTPYKGVVVFHGLGSGKTCAGVAIAEKFKEQVQKYNTKVHILVPGPLIKESWKYHLIKCTGETYLKHHDKSTYVNDQELNRMRKNATNQALQFYKIMSYRSFYKRVLGEKIVDKKVVKGSKVRVSYRKTEEGEFERDISVDRIYNLNNSLIIVDEAHSLTGNAYGEALKHIIKNSTNLRIVLLSATPMKNLADDIIELINFLRPQDSPLVRDKIFNSHKNHLMDFKPGGMEYFQRMVKGYVSHVRGADPLTYARRLDKGKRPKGLKFTKVIQCKMLDFQMKAYTIAVSNTDDALDRKSEAVANFVFPGFTQDRKGIVGYYGREGLNLVKNQLKIAGDQLNKQLSQVLFGDKTKSSDVMYITADNKTITGKILKLPYLKYFSIKFYKAMKKINRLVWGKKGAKSAFVYSNLVKVGIELFQEILLQNGYLEYQDDTSNYQINNDTICYFCGKTYREHKSGMSRMRHFDQHGGEADSEDTHSDVDTDSDTDDEASEEFETGDNEVQNISELDISDSSTEYDNKEKDKIMPSHKFYPATFISVTGKSTDDGGDNIPEEKKRILDNVFNSLDNKEGKYIKLVLGSKVMNEGISLANVGEVHILDVYFNLGKVDQVVGRAIRNCSHYRQMSERNPFPVVKVYKYVVKVEKGLSSEEELYRKAEDKYILIKKVERAMKEVAIDCPLNINGNIFAEEVDQHGNCVPYGTGDDMCPKVCDYTKCEYKCKDNRLNAKFYDPNRRMYRKLDRSELDYSTFTHGLARSEIDYSKDKIKEMYVTKYMYGLDDILKYVKDSYMEDKKDLFDPFFVYRALYELLPTTSNDFNNFKDTIIDKHYNTGYLIHRSNYYIFQPFDQNEDVPMYYRTNYNKEVKHKLSLYNYLKNTIEYKELKTKKGSSKGSEQKGIFKDDGNVYDFEATVEYYDGRSEFDYVGIIDKELSRRKSKRPEEMNDVFKIREKRSKILEKKRGTGIPSLKGAVCSTSKNKEYLENIAKKLKIKLNNTDTRTHICEKIKNKMLELEKYSTTKDKNKFTYMMIPINHAKYPFPYNLEDRIKHITDKIKNTVKYKLSISTKIGKVKSGSDKGRPSYTIKFKCDKSLKEYNGKFDEYGAKMTDKEIVIVVE